MIDQLKKSRKEFNDKFVRKDDWSIDGLTIFYVSEPSKNIIDWHIKQQITLIKAIEAEIDNAIAVEITIAQKEGQRTSRLTSLSVKLTKTLNSLISNNK